MFKILIIACGVLGNPYCSVYDTFGIESFQSKEDCEAVLSGKEGEALETGRLNGWLIGDTKVTAVCVPTVSSHQRKL